MEEILKEVLNLLCKKDGSFICVGDLCFPDDLDVINNILNSEKDNNVFNYDGKLYEKTLFDVNGIQGFQLKNITHERDHIFYKLLSKNIFRKKFIEYLKETQNEPFSYVMIDLDNFKSINDTSGHIAGDTVLAEIGRILTQYTDMTCRGGDEFFMIFKGKTEDEVLDIMSEIKKRVSSIKVNGSAVTFSAGTYTTVYSGFVNPIVFMENIKEIVDHNMYSQKLFGKNGIHSTSNLQLFPHHLWGVQRTK